MLTAEDTHISIGHPRLPRASLTEEDFNILAKGYRDCPIPPGVPLRTPFWHGLLMGLAMCTEDADLMFKCQSARSRTFPVDMPALQMIASDGRLLDCGGAIFLPVNRERG